MPLGIDSYLCHPFVHNVLCTITLLRKAYHITHISRLVIDTDRQKGGPDCIRMVKLGRSNNYIRIHLNVTNPYNCTKRHFNGSKSCHSDILRNCTQPGLTCCDICLRINKVSKLGLREFKHLKVIKIKNSLQYSCSWNISRPSES